MRKEDKKIWFDLQVGVDLLGQPLLHRIWTEEEGSRPKERKGRDLHRSTKKGKR
jgi:hypothetical protein